MSLSCNSIWIKFDNMIQPTNTPLLGHPALVPTVRTFGTSRMHSNDIDHNLAVRPREPSRRCGEFILLRH